ncbi:FAD/NAD(P)-binding domain-containing protein [Lentithecium fluviatile CBS 122367]|uniref:FAD/NAD(P)-binding domain-containing protein n=1 Tax=Lentithecium fluviatile CBS 122367 TaxID=1168545 RepID=A0A6G1IWP4_9PLEO|nr:FAD/NAD(P)-binding domain-containing protein [Lentithecium fluviatile CBS 122367]
MSTLPQSCKAKTPLNVLIIGAGCAGPALALLLQRVNPKHTITVIERFPSLRTGGQQLDLKAQGVPIARGMGILGDLKAACVHETGMKLVDKNGKSLIQFGINDSSTPKQGLALTNEYEIMRGDMVKVFYDGSIMERERIERGGETEGGLTYKFNTTVTRLDQSDSRAEVTFSDGQKKHYDLVVAADGQNSRTRRMAFGDETNAKCFRSLGVHAAYFEIPRIESDHSDARIFFAPCSRMVMTRTGNRSTTQVYLFIMKDKERHERMKGVHKQSLEKQKEAWTEIFQDAGWECKRFMEGMKTTEDFYAHEIGQVHMPQLHSGRVVLLGDAGYCPSPFTGMGTTLSLIGSYILTGEIAKHGDDVDAALQAYHEGMQAPLQKYQRIAGGAETSFYPSSEFGIKITNNVLWILSSLKVDKLIMWVGGLLPESKDELALPIYPEPSLGNETRD